MTILYNESHDAYHANAAIGSGDIRAYLHSPQLFRDQQTGLVQRETAALLFGIATHSFLLEPHDFVARYAIKPAGMSFAKTEGKMWQAEVEAQRKCIVSANDYATLSGMLARMPEQVKTIFAGCKREVTYRTTIPLPTAVIPVQCRFDLSGEMAYDLKSIDSIESVSSSIWKRKYHVQQRWYQRVERAETGLAPRPFRFIFAEKVPPYRWRVVELDADYRAIADKEIDEALAGIAARTKSGCWEDPDELFQIESPPEWMHDLAIVVPEEEEE